jgi:ATP-binding cassette subfamily B protein
MQTVQSFTHEEHDRAAFSAAVESSFNTAKLRILARSGMTAIAIVLIFAGVTGILWLGAQQVLDGTMTGGTLSQFILYAVLCATAIGALSEVWGEVQLAAGATERLIEILEVEPEIQAPVQPESLAATDAGPHRFFKYYVSISDTTGYFGAGRVFARRHAGRDRGFGRCFGCR